MCSWARCDYGTSLTVCHIEIMRMWLSLLADIINWAYVNISRVHALRQTFVWFKRANIHTNSRLKLSDRGNVGPNKAGPNSRRGKCKTETSFATSVFRSCLFHCMHCGPAFSVAAFSASYFDPLFFLVSISWFCIFSRSKSSSYWVLTFGVYRVFTCRNCSDCFTFLILHLRPILRLYEIFSTCVENSIEGHAACPIF